MIVEFGIDYIDE
ncbi:Protein of unknown function [Bacillus wiedmannii]|nr:Protein of unknown function [Bacillus wiedmannii]